MRHLIQSQISSAEEFLHLRLSENPAEYRTAADGWAEESVWRDVVERFPEMKTWVIHNKTVPLSILDLLSQDIDPQLRRDVADKRKLSRELFERLARDSDAGVRYSIAGNPKIPADILLTLCEDPEDWVRKRAHEAKLSKDDKLV